MKNVGSENHTKARRGGQLIEERVRPHGRVRPDGQGDQDAQELREAQDEEGGGQALQDEGVHVHPAHEGEAPVPLSMEANQRR